MVESKDASEVLAPPPPGRAGRPPLYGEKMRTVRIRLPESMMRKARFLGDARGYGFKGGMSQVVRDALERELKECLGEFSDDELEEAIKQLEFELEEAG